MSEIQVIVPLAVLAGAKELTPEGIIEYLQTAVDNHAAVDRAEMRIMFLENTIHSIGVNLEKIWENAPDEFTRAKNIRGLISNLKSSGTKGVSDDSNHL